MLNRLRFSIGAQLFLLLFVAVLVAQAIIVLLVLLMPPPVRPIYELAEVAERLQGATVQPLHGEMLKRELRATPPQIEAPLLEEDGWDPRRDALAGLLRLPPSDVLLAEFPHEGPGRRRGAMILQHRGPPPPHHGPFGGSPPVGIRGMFEGGRTWIGGPFVAAMHLPSGEWVVVEPEAEPFLTPWARRLLLWFVASTASLALIAAFFARRFAKPIREFATAADRLGKQLNHPPLTPSGPSELRVAVAAFNRMQERLLRYVGDRTAMLAAIAHDLRTPMMRLRFRLEQTSPDLREPALEDLREMQAMVQGVLAFVRDESTAGPRQRIDLASLLESLVDDMRVTGASVELAEAPNLVVEGDGAALRRLFGNLIDNAIKYGGVARLRLTREGDDAVTRIEDEGPGLAPHELERVFEPFYRAEPSRNRETGGIGLGLAVVRTLVRAHGGDVSLESTAHGLIATVRLPLGD
ncbi:sensor histidine kinase [Roseiterribacter gracilis]|uniref:histidine kinase n=1 Tax=Roseiterribacter gracilis TaxID=2812848 RepID=A0A8S8XI22_9PROT|nr:two-component sensor histidine kinase [Rhodospirillales bacterium TMPK1]